MLCVLHTREVFVMYCVMVCGLFVFVFLCLLCVLFRCVCVGVVGDVLCDAVRVAGCFG